MKSLSARRLGLALRNDLVRLAPRVGIATLAFVGVGLLAWLGNADSSDNQEVAPVLFTTALLLGGVLFTSMSWNDMHHPQGRFHYLMLPYSNAERFISRYLVTAPLYVLWVCLAFAVFQLLANGLSGLLLGSRVQPVSWFSREMLGVVVSYLWLQPLAFAGAIRFRSYALAKTAAFGFGCLLLLTLISVVAVRLFYWTQFTGFMTPVGTVRFGLLEMVQPWHVSVTATLLALWVLYLGWLYLRDHEVQDGL